MLVHHGGDFLVFEGFVLHDVAPMAGGVADGEEDEFVFLFREGECLIAPWQPVYGVVGVLEEVGGGFLGEGVRHVGA